MEEQLKKVLKSPEVLFIGINGVIGGGIFLLPGQVAKLAGAQAVWAYLVAGIVCVLIGLSFAEASTMFNRTGGPYVYAEEAMGKTAGFTVGWMVWLTYLLGWAALSNGFVDYLRSLYPALGTYRPIIIVVLIAALCALNTIGVRNGSAVINFFTIAKLIPLLMLIVFGLFYAGNAGLQLVPPGTGQFGQAVLLLIFAYGGFEIASIPAGEMVNPRRSISTAILGTLAGVTIFYMLIQYAALRINPNLAAAKAPIASVGSLMFAGGLFVMTLGALLSILGTQSGIVLAAPRTLYALGANASIPKLFAYVHPKYKTPVAAIWTTGIIVILLAVTGTFTHLILLNVAARLYQYLMVCVSVIILRFRQKTTERPFKLPLGITFPVIGTVLCIWLIAQETAQQLLYAVGALIIGLVLFWISRLTQTKQTPV